MSLQILFPLKCAPLPPPPFPLGSSPRLDWPCDGPVVTGWMLTQRIYWKMVGECHSRCSLDCAAQNRFIPWLVGLSWVSKTHLTPIMPCGRPVDGAWQMSILSSTTPTGLPEAVRWEGTSFPPLLLSSSDDTVHACQWVTHWSPTLSGPIFKYFWQQNDCRFPWFSNRKVALGS